MGDFSWREAEALGVAVRELSGAPDGRIVSSRAMGSSIGLRFSTAVRRGCLGILDPHARCVHAHVHGATETQNFNTGHEITHFVALLGGIQKPHNETLIDAGALASLLPWKHTERVVREVGWDDPNALAERLPGVADWRALLRAAWVAGRPVALHLDGARLVWAPDDYVVPERGVWWEQTLVRQVRKDHTRHLTLMGAAGVPFGRAGSGGVLVFLPDHPEGW